MNSNQNKKPKLILFVDDELGQHMHIDLLFRGMDNYVIEGACTGEEAIEKARDFAGRIDLLILDMMLPDISGDELYAMLQQDGLAKDVPVIFVTGLREPNARVRELIKAGKAEFINKSDIRTELFIAIEKCLGH